MKRRVLPAALLAALGSTGCGQDVAPPENPFAKRVPRIRQTHLGGTLDDWIVRSTDADPAVRSQAAWALGALAGTTPKRVETLRTLLADADANVQYAAVVAAGRVPLTDADSARRVAAHLDAPPLRRAARNSLAYMGRAAVEPLRRSLTSEDTMARWSAAWALLRLGAEAEAAVPDLMERLQDDPDRAVRRQVALALGHAGRAGPRALAPLLDHEDAGVRMLAERGLRNAGPEAIPTLVGLLKGENPEHADFAAAVFSNRVSLASLAVPALVSVLDGEGPYAIDAADALVNVGVDARPALGAARKAASSDAAREAINDVLLRIAKNENAKR